MAAGSRLPPYLPGTAQASVSRATCPPSCQALCLPCLNLGPGLVSTLNPRCPKLTLKCFLPRGGGFDCKGLNALPISHLPPRLAFKVNATASPLLPSMAIPPAILYHYINI